MKNLLLVGAGAGSREVLLMINRINQQSPLWNVLGFLDEDPEKIGTKIDGYPVYGPEYTDFGEDVHGASGIMNSSLRNNMLEKYIEKRGYGLPVLIAPDVIVPDDFAAGPGTIIMPSTTISFDVQLGKGVFVLWGSALGHHLRVGEYATILSFATITGHCKVGARTTIGARATLSVNVTVGQDSLIGVGTTVLNNVGDGKRLLALPRQIESAL